MATHGPTHVFGLLGTTRARAGQGLGSAVPETYEAVDYGLTAMLIDAAALLTPQPRFVYLSAAGVKPSRPGSYFEARWKVEQALQGTGLPWTIARPCFITGPDRDDSRPGERLGAALGDAALSLAGLLGGGRLRARYRSNDPRTLAAALVRLAADPACVGRVCEGEELR